MLNPEALNSYRHEGLQSCKHEMRCGDDDGDNGDDNNDVDGNDGNETNDNNCNDHHRFNHRRIEMNNKFNDPHRFIIVVIIMMVAAIVTDTITNITTLSPSSAQPPILLWLRQSNL